MLSKTAFLRLYQGQLSTAGKTANVLRDALPALNRTMTGPNVVELTKTLDVRFALASMAIQVIGMWNGVKSWFNATSDSSRTDATYGVLDSLFGFTGGALQLSAVYAAVAQSACIGALKFFGCATGIAGGGINLVASWKKRNDQNKLGNSTAAELDTMSALASGGTLSTSTALTAGSLAGTLAARAVGGAMVEAVAVRLGANAVLATVGGTRGV
ncbi:hypothetical protein [Duganella sp. 1411]|uniref:hypothetical protein n=1 Tax=Duganella sp. 1411 TaxID=2806572 RepID=UPI001E4B14FC|nr:hypothetical protein [Duganella sp. 1411]